MEMTDRPDLQECAEKAAAITGEEFDCTSISLLVRRASRGYEVAMAANGKAPSDAEVDLAKRLIETLAAWTEAQEPARESEHT